ncbi:MAG: hypothetical protein R3Y09_02310 [Clostridia bacterium]
MEKFHITAEQLKLVPFKVTGSSMTDFCREIDRVIANENMEKLAPHKVMDWFVSIGYLAYQQSEEPGKGITPRPTALGLERGIRLDYRHTEARGDYIINLYSTELQQFILDKIDEIVASFDA